MDIVDRKEHGMKAKGILKSVACGFICFTAGYVLGCCSDTVFPLKGSNDDFEDDFEDDFDDEDLDDAFH